MKRNELTKIVEWLGSQHRRRTLVDDHITVFYPRKHFPGSDVQSIRKRFNAIHYDMQCKAIIEHDAIVVYDTIDLGKEI